ncbi:DNA ligase 1, partial [Lecanoromycetidae sp. Uapishka_2]
MSTPSKRRKTNNHQSSPQTVRSLDFFFGKQKSGSVPGKPVSSDEELARKLQAEWDEQDRAPQSNHDHASKAEGAEESLPEIVDCGGREDGPKSEDTQAALRMKDTLGLQSAASAEDVISSNIPFDENPLTFDPSTYIPDLKRHWATEGGNASYGLLTRCFVLVNSTQSRIKIVDTLVNFLRTIIEGDPDSLLPAVWLATNAISPPYISLELGLGGSAISKALKKTCMLDNPGLKSLYDKFGDAGDVAFEAKKRQSFTLRKPKPLSIKGVYESLVKVANSKGNGSQEFKQRIVERLLQDAQGAEESRYLVRTLAQHLRIGAVKTTMLIALSRACLMSRPPGVVYDIKSQPDLAKLRKENLAEVYAKGEELVKACFARRPNYNDLVPCLLEVGISDELLLRCGLALHIPLRPMLGSITRDLGEMLTKLQGRDFSCEYKYDGQRAQVHCDEAGKVSIFSRHLEVMTDKYPDLVALVPQIRGESVSSFILEGEVVAIDQESGGLKAFQTLTNRARKDVAIGSIKVDVCLFSFDLMYLNGEELLDRPFRERRELLRSLFVEIPHRFTWVKNIDATSADSETVLEFFKSATDIKCEGIMVKVLDNVPNPSLQIEIDDEGDEPQKPIAPIKPIKPTKKSKSKVSTVDKAEEKEKATRRKALLSTYEPDKRLDSWLKVKKDYNTSADTIDLIPIAAWHGQGRKAKWWSPILLAVRNPTTGSLEAVTKCISGFTDKFYKENKERYNEDTGENLISRPSYIEYPYSPDVWFEPQEVWEMAFADITKSPTYTAAIGLVDEDRGLSMRFPRFLKVREDKSIDEASTADFLAELWFKQEAKGGGAGMKEVPDMEEDD